ncbi:MAG: acyl-CoA dehydratase activase [Bilifractor sp.]
MIYYMCKYTPLEVFAGFGKETCRLERVNAFSDTADSLSHPNICGYGKGILEAASDPAVQELVLVNCCDVVRRIYDILKLHGKQSFLYLLDLPHKNSETEEAYLEKQIERLIHAYEAYSGIPFDMEKALSSWTADPSGCGACGLGKVSPAVHNTPEKVEEEQTYVSLQGAHSGPALPEILGKSLSVSVRDDTCGGNRFLAVPHSLFPALQNARGGAERKRIWIRSYAHALLHQMPCMRMEDVHARENLGKNALGIVYHTIKFCDYYGFEYSSLRKRADKPVLKIETDGTGQNSGQISTRLDAFAESLHLSHYSGSEEKGLNHKGTYIAGVDSGSASTDAVILDAGKNIVGWAVVPTGSGAASGADKALAEALLRARLGRNDLGEIVTTGYGRDSIGMGDHAVTEITCHARGAHYLDPEVRTVIDIGGQDSKVIRIDENGMVQNFTMNDKCAAGTGRFLEMMARTMELSLEEMSSMGMKWKNDIQISSMCTVFAESEVVSLIAGNAQTSDIIHGLNTSVANRVASLVKRAQGCGPYMMTGGVARNEGVVEALRVRLGEKIRVSQYAQLCGAIGAALSAMDN